MKFDDAIEMIYQDERVRPIPVLYVVQILAIIFDLFRLEEK